MKPIVKISNNCKMHSRITIAFAILLLMSNIAYAQHQMMMSFMSTVPQSARNNPAFFPDYGGHFALVMPNLEFSFSNSGFRYSDLIVRQPDDSLLVDVNNALAAMEDLNHLTSNFSLEALSFGFRVRNNYFSFSTAPRAQLLFSYPKDFFRLLAEGNSGFIGQTVNIGNFNVALNAWNEIALGYARRFNDQLTVGIRIKHLTGIVSATTQRAIVNLHTDPASYHLNLQTDLLSFASIPGEESFDLMENSGFAIDFGVSFKPIYQLTLKAGITDLGRIQWNINTVNYRSLQNSNFTFEGFDLADFFNGTTNPMNNLGDTLAEIFEPEEFKEPFYTNLGSRMYFGAAYILPNEGSVGIYFQGESRGGTFFPSFGLMYNQPIGNRLNLMAAYSIHNRSFNNLGLGLNLNLGPLQFYALTGNVVSLFLPQHAKTASVQLGFNFLINRNLHNRAINGGE